MDDKLVEEIVEFVSALSTDTKIYIGCDSQRSGKDGKRQWYRYTTVAVVHIDGSRGCKVFVVEESVEEDFGVTGVRLMNEVYKAIGAFLAIRPAIDEAVEIEVHLDLNQKKEFKSNDVAQQAIGLVRGMCGVDPKLKPYGLAASNCADHWSNGKFKETAEECKV